MCACPGRGTPSHAESQQWLCQGNISGPAAVPKRPYLLLSERVVEALVGRDLPRAARHRGLQSVERFDTASNYSATAEPVLSSVAERKRRLEVVPRVGAERDQRFGVTDPPHLPDPRGDDVGQLVVGAGPDDRGEIVTPGHRVYLRDAGKLSQLLGDRVDLVAVHVQQHDGRDHYGTAPPPQLPSACRTVG